jgi:hypothetical protein
LANNPSAKKVYQIYIFHMCFADRGMRHGQRPKDVSLKHINAFGITLRNPHSFGSPDNPGVYLGINIIYFFGGRIYEILSALNRNMSTIKDR